MRSRRVLVSATLGAIALGPAVLWGATEVVQTVSEQRRGEHLAAAEAVTLPEAYREVPCGTLGAPVDAAHRCWRTDPDPDATHDDLRTALQEVGVTRPAAECQSHTPLGPRSLACWAAGDVGGRELLLVAELLADTPDSTGAAADEGGQTSLDAASLYDNGTLVTLWVSVD
jgi:hypothetical protein